MPRLCASPSAGDECAVALALWNTSTRSGMMAMAGFDILAMSQDGRSAIVLWSKSIRNGARRRE